MATGNGAVGWRRFFGLSRGERQEPAEILGQLYIDQTQQAELLRRYAAGMKYPQFRDRLLSMASEKTIYAERIAEKLGALGRRLPPVSEVAPVHQNSWKQLMHALEEESRSADRLQTQLHTVAAGDQATFALLEEIVRMEKKHPDAIRYMLMRSDPLASSLA